MSPNPLCSTPTSVQFRARPGDLSVMALALCSVYSKLRLHLDNCSHEDILSPCCSNFMCLFNDRGVPEGRRASPMWQIPTNCPALTMNSRSPHGSRVQSCRTLFPWQTYSSHQTERPCSCTQTPNNRMPVLEQRRLGPLFGEGGNVSGWSNISGVLQ